MADAAPVPDAAVAGGDGTGKEKKKKRSVKKTKDSAEVPAVDDGDNVAPTIVEGPSKPETPKAMKSASAPATDAAGGGVGDDGQREVTPSRPQDAVSSGSVGADKKNEEGKHSDVPPEDADKRRAKEASPSAAALLAQEILSPVMATLPPESDEPYVPPTAVEAGDMNALQELDERKIIELREAFNLFDLDHDGCIDAADLKATFATLGVEVPDEFIAGMLADAMDPLDFQSFVLMYGIRTIEMDPEAVLLEALSKWDKERTGQISIERMKHDLMSFGNKFSEEEANAALLEVPIVKGTGDAFGCTGPLMFDYLTFCQKIGGFRKRRKQDPVFIH